MTRIRKTALALSLAAGMAGLALFPVHFLGSDGRDLPVSTNGSIEIDQTTDLPTWPQAEWQRAAQPEDMGWSSDGLEEARLFAASIGTDATLIIDRGLIVQQWGDITRPFQVQSVRKSLVSALVGMAMEETGLSLEDTLEKLEIDDDPPLSEGEKQARLVDLLTSRSGVYHRPVYESADQARNRPDRGTHEPGQHFFYNNWGFNAVGTIVSNALGDDVFSLFQRRIAQVTQMQDYSLEDTEYRRGKESTHPAYLVEMSARDLGRFGLLYLRGGTWREKRLVDAEWVKLSTSTQVENATENRGYGYMWWTYPRYGNFYAASGSGGQLVIVMPDQDLVLVHLAAENRLGRGGVGARDFWQLFGKIMAAKQD